MAARPRRQVRYEEYAAHGPAEDARGDKKDDGGGDDQDEVPPVRSGSRGAKSSSGPPAHSAATSHRQNDAYMEAFDSAYEDLVQKHGGMTMSDSKRSSQPSPGAASGGANSRKATTKEHSLRDQEPLPSNQNLSGAWLSGPASPDGTVHSVSAQPIMCLSLSPDEREIVVGSSDHALYTIPVASSSSSSSAPSNSRTGTRSTSSAGSGRMRTLYTKKFGHTEWVTCSTYLPDNRIVSGGMDSKLCLWDATGVKCEELLGHAGSVTLVRALGDDLLLSASYDKTVRVWNVSRKASSRQREVSTIKVGSSPILDASLLSSSSSTSTSNAVATGDRDGCVHIVDLEDGKVSRKIAGAHKGHTTSVLASRFEESALCFSGGQDGTVRVWDLRQKSSSPAAHALELHIDKKSGKAGAVGFLHEPLDDSNILITGGADGTIKVLDKRKSFKTLFNFTEHMDFIYSMHIRGQLCFSGAGNGMLHVHDWKQGKLLYGLGANKAAVRAIETTATQLVAAGDDGTVMMYDMN